MKEYKEFYLKANEYKYHARSVENKIIIIGYLIDRFIRKNKDYRFVSFKYGHHNDDFLKNNITLVFRFVKRYRKF